MLNMADLPDDAAALKAIVIAVHARNARLELLVAAFKQAFAMGLGPVAAPWLTRA